MVKINPRVYYSFILVICLIIFTACSSNEAPPKEEDSQAAVSKEEVDTETDEPSSDTTEKEETNDTTKEQEEMDTPTDAEGILKKAAEAMSQLSGMTLIGETKSTGDIMGMKSNETSQITGTLSFAPLAQHLNIHAEAEANGVTDITDSEMYVTEEAMYMSDPESGGWFSIPMQQAGATGNVSAMISQSQMDSLADQHQLFELTENDETYILTLSGSGEAFKEVVFGGLKEVAGEESYQSFTDMIQDFSGTYEFIISKDTFYIITLNMDIKQTIDTGLGEINSNEQIHYEYNDFNNVEAVSVPAEVTENAQSPTAPGSTE